LNRRKQDNECRGEGDTILTVLRKYSGTGARVLVDILEKRKAEVESVMGSVDGFVSYTLARTGDGGFAVTVCKDKRGIDESMQKAREFIAKEAAHTGVGAPQILEGTVIAHL
jgi:hypothetical protein